MQTRYIVLVAILAMAHTTNPHRTEVPIPSCDGMVLVDSM